MKVAFIAETFRIQVRDFAAGLDSGKTPEEALPFLGRRVLQSGIRETPRGE